MTTFIGIRGTAIQAVSSDPANPEVGQIWYNSSSGTLKGYKFVGTWSSGGNLNTGRVSGGSAGTATAALAWDGFLNPGYSTATESYNGTSWTNLPATYPTGTGDLGSSGTQTAALGFGGYAPGPSYKIATSASWNGTSWTATPSMNTARYYLGGMGTQTATLAFAGSRYPLPNTTETESWNGTSWTVLPASMNTARGGLAGAGTQTAGLGIGNAPASAPGGNTESWNGSTWTSVASLNTGRNAGGSSGTQTAALYAGGQPSSPTYVGLTNAEIWNGSAWTATGTLATSRYGLFGSGPTGTQTAGLVMGGTNAPGVPGNRNNTELFTGLKTQTLTVS